MGSEQDGIGPLLEAKRKIDAAIELHLSKINALRKRSDAVQSAVHVLRSSDDELMDLPDGMVLREKKKRIVGFDTVAVEEAITDFLKTGPKGLKTIVQLLSDKGMEFSMRGLKNILKTAPQFIITGERELTRYSVNMNIVNRVKEAV